MGLLHELVNPQRPHRVIALVLAVALLLGAGVVATRTYLLDNPIGGLFATEQVLGQADAAATALSKVAELRPDIAGWVADTPSRMRLRELKDERGNVVFSLEQETDAWVLALSAPAQGGYNEITAHVIVDARSGSVIAAGVSRANP